MEPFLFCSVIVFMVIFLHLRSGYLIRISLSYGPQLH